MAKWCQMCQLEDAVVQITFTEQTGIFTSTRYIQDLCRDCGETKTELAANGSIWEVKKLSFLSKTTYDYNLEEKKWIRRV
jgi:hypothetical protein